MGVNVSSKSNGETTKLEVLLAKATLEMNERIMPFWMKLKDEVNGGFFGGVDFDLNLLKEAPKGGVAGARLLWTYSAAYRVTKEEAYLACAHHAFEFLKNHLMDQVAPGIFWLVNYAGEPLDTRKHVYSNVFAIYALSEYARATQSDEATAMAISLFEWIEKTGYDPSRRAYLEEFNRNWEPTQNEMLSENGLIAEITTNTHLHVIEAYTNLYKLAPSERLKGRIENLLEIFYTKIWNTETGYLNVFFDKNWQSLIDLKSYGHDIEASWLLDAAMKAIGCTKKAYTEMNVKIAKNIQKNAISPLGLLLNENEQGVENPQIIWWGQAEAIVGFLNAYELTHDVSLLESALTILEGTETYMYDRRPGGEWYWAVDFQGNPIVRDLVEPWKLNYHNGRFCLEVIERLSQLENIEIPQPKFNSEKE